jgi:hypothetical protein
MRAPGGGGVGKVRDGGHKAGLWVS